MKLYFLFVTVLAAFSQTCLAQAYKCTDAEGKVTYSDMPCPSNSGSKRVRVIDNAIDGSEARTAIAAEREMLRAQERQQSRVSKQSNRVSLAGSRDCKDAMRSYEIEVGSIRKDRDAIAAKKLQAQLKCGLLPNRVAKGTNKPRKSPSGSHRSKKRRPQTELTTARYRENTFHHQR